jgi:hypothetical protein
MWMTAIRIMTGVLLCLLPACASEPAFIPLRPDVSQQLNSSNGVIAMSQKEIVADVEKSNVATYTGGGLIPALIDVAVESSRASSAEDNLKSIRNALVDYEVGTELHNALKAQLDGISWLHVKKTEVIHDNKPKQVQNLLAASSEDALLLLRPTYRLSSGFSVLRMETEVRVVPRATHLIAPEAAKDDDKRMTPLYKTKVFHHIPLATGGGSQEDAAKAWTSSGGAQIKDAMRQSVSTIADKIIEALRHPENAQQTP